MADSKITFKNKVALTCPVCQTKFHREELLTGRGRMNAADMTDELHRQYHTTAKYGDVYPLLYPIVVCPECWFASFFRHFEKIEQELVQVMHENIDKRKNLVKKVLPDVDFTRDRTLIEGVASNILAATCYEHFPQEYAPTFLRALCYLRAGWLCKYLHHKNPGENYDYMTLIFLRKATFFYSHCIELHQQRIENHEEIPHHGPDIDNNFGLDGIYYLTGVLQLKYGQRKHKDKRIESLKHARIAISRFFGLGQSSKAKPSVLLDRAREIHNEIKEEIILLGDES